MSGEHDEPHGVISIGPVPEGDQKRLDSLKQALVKISNMWVDKTCPICSRDQWQIGDLLEIRAFANGKLYPGSADVTPVFPVACINCGYTIFFNALLAGWDPPQEGLYV